MYEEMLERLRNNADHYMTVEGAVGLVHLLTDAADAIEERDRYALTLQQEMMAEAESHIALVERLNKQVEELQKNVAYWQAQLVESMCGATLMELEKPCWIPVTEPPKKDGWYQVYAPGYSGGSSSGLKNINGNMYSAFKHGKWSVEVGYHKRPGCVKAWMPLPEPPKEEE